MKICPQCTSNLTHDLQTKETCWGEHKVIVTNVPTISCSCGEVFYNTKVAIKLQKLAINYGTRDNIATVDFAKELTEFKSVGGIV